MSNYKKLRICIVAIALIILIAVCVSEQTLGNLRSADSPLEVNVAEKTTIVPNTPQWSPEQIIGADMAELDYASDDIIIFHGYFGLYVYDLKSLEIIRSLDLKSINCNFTQGDEYCEVAVSMDGNTVQLHPGNSENMYIYNVSEHTLLETTYQPREDTFDSMFVSIEGLENGNYSYKAVRFNANEYGVLHTEDWTLGTLSYVRGDMIYSLFNVKE